MPTVTTDQLNEFITDRLNEYNRAGLMDPDHPEPARLVDVLVYDLRERFTILESGSDPTMHRPIEGFDFNLVHIPLACALAEQIESDVDEDQGPELLHFYNHAPAPVKEIINKVFIFMCGYSLHTLAKFTGGINAQSNKA